MEQKEIITYHNEIENSITNIKKKIDPDPRNLINLEIESLKLAKGSLEQEEDRGVRGMIDDTNKLIMQMYDNVTEIKTKESYQQGIIAQINSDIFDLTEKQNKQFISLSKYIIEKNNQPSPKDTQTNHNKEKIAKNKNNSYYIATTLLIILVTLALLLENKPFLSFLNKIRENILNQL